MMLFRSTIHWSAKLHTSFTSIIGTSFQLTLCIQGLQPQKIEFIVPAIITRLAVYKSFHGQPVWNSRDNASKTMINGRGLNTEP